MKKTIFILYTMFEKLISTSDTYEKALLDLGLIDEIVVKVVIEKESIHA